MFHSIDPTPRGPGRWLRLPIDLDLRTPAGEPAWVGADSVSWQVFRNPVSVFIGGVTAVILELAEPRVRSGVWEHTRFRTHPLERLERTGAAAMIAVYGARSVAREQIAQVNRMHERITGSTPSGVAYRASDPELLRWVQATASFGFVEAYARFVQPLSREERDRFYAEGRDVARLYGASGAPECAAAQRALFDAMRERLEPSPIVFEFLDIARAMPLLPRPLQGLQRAGVAAAVELTPPDVREILGLGPSHGLGASRERMLRALARLAGRVVVRAHPAVQACERLGLPRDYLWRH